MNIEEQLKTYILARYKSLKLFANECGLPYTTLMSVLTRGIGHASVGTIFQICDALNIDPNALAKNKIIENSEGGVGEYKHPFLLKYDRLNAEGKRKVEAYVNDLLDSGNYGDDETCATLDVYGEKSLG